MRKGSRVSDIRHGSSRYGVIVDILPSGGLVVDWGFKLENRNGKIAVSSRIEEVIDDPFNLEIVQGEDDERLYF